MGLSGRGKVQGGCIVLVAPLGLPDGTEVDVHVEPRLPSGPAAGPAPEFTSLPFFGMATGREDLGDSAAWVREEHERWHRRATRQD